MSGKGGKLLPVFMCLLTLAGFLLPYGASALQDSRLAAQTQPRALTDIRLTLQKEAGIDRTLQILSEGYTVVGLQGGDRPNLQEPDAAAHQAVKLLTREGLLPQFAWDGPLPELAWEMMENEVMAVISHGDRSDSAVIWAYTFWAESDSASCIVWIDDATGKLVNVNYVVDNQSLAAEGNDQAMLEAGNKALAERWVAFIPAYYSLESAVVGGVYSDETESTYSLLLTWAEEEETASCKLPIKFHGGSGYSWW